MSDSSEWDGRTYYASPQLKPAPFSYGLVGSYVFLAGLSGAAQLLATMLDLGCGRAAEATVRRGRFLSLLAPSLGTLCLILDLHTPQRFYNMLRVVKTTSPMSLGSWALVGFSGASTVTAVMQFVSDHGWGLSWVRHLARVMQIPAALTGGFLATYTASLFSATSTPRWASGGEGLAVKFAAASVASAAAAMQIGERSNRRARDLNSIAIAALAVELAATLHTDQAQRQAGIRVSPSTADRLGVTLPLSLFLVSQLLPGRARRLSTVASVAALAGSLAMRIGVMRQGVESAARPAISMRFAQPDNLPDRHGVAARGSDRRVSNV
jgi:formate-dependent nitrite reductase membrane component NrfD